MVRAILVLALLLLVARAFWRIFDGVMEAAGSPSRRSSRTPARGVKLVRDPVCGTFVAPSTSLALTAGNTTHYFCSETCMAAFKKSGR